MAEDHPVLGTNVHTHTYKTRPKSKDVETHQMHMRAMATRIAQGITLATKKPGQQHCISRAVFTTNDRMYRAEDFILRLKANIAEAEIDKTFAFWSESWRVNSRHSYRAVCWCMKRVLPEYIDPATLWTFPPRDVASSMMELSVE